MTGRVGRNRTTPSERRAAWWRRGPAHSPPPVPPSGSSPAPSSWATSPAAPSRSPSPRSVWEEWRSAASSTVRPGRRGAPRPRRPPSTGTCASQCDHGEASLVGDWWLGGPVPCLLARAATDLTELVALTWNFDLHWASRFTLSHVEAREWRRSGHRTARCGCNAPGDCPFYRFLRVADASGSSDDSDW